MPLATAFALLLTSWRGNQRDRHQLWTCPVAGRSATVRSAAVVD